MPISGRAEGAMGKPRSQLLLLGCCKRGKAELPWASAPRLRLLGLAGSVGPSCCCCLQGEVWSQDNLLPDGRHLFQALLPVGNSCDLFYHPPPLFPTSQHYLLRPLLPRDKVGATAQGGGPHHSVQS